MPRKPSPCGTESAYKRHIRKSEPIDDACRDAHNEHAKNVRNSKREKAEQEKAQRLEAEIKKASLKKAEALGTVDEVQDLLFLRDKLILAIEAQLNLEPSKISSLTKELRLTNEKIASIQQAVNPVVPEKEAFDDLLGRVSFSLTATPKT